jgi:preprotein translocase subunit SecD
MFGEIVVLTCSQGLAQTPAHTSKLIEFRAVNASPAPGFHAVKSVNHATVYLADSPLISDDDIEDATTDTSALNPGLLILNVRFKPSAGARLRDFTQHHVGELLAVLLNGELDGTPPRIMDPISGPSVMITLPLDESAAFAAAVAARWPSAH